MNKIVMVCFYDHSVGISLFPKDFIGHPLITITVYGEVIHESDQFLDIQMVQDSQEDNDNVGECRSQFFRIFKPAIIRLTELKEIQSVLEGKS